MRAKIGMAAVGVICFAVLVGIAWAQSVPQLINYQGRLTDSAGQPLADGWIYYIWLRCLQPPYRFF